MPKAMCKIVNPVQFQETIDCQMAAFGAQIHAKGSATRVVAASPIDSCTELKENVQNAIVLTVRGVCSFESKMRQIAKAGAAAMILINQDNSLFSMGALNVVNVSIPALVMAKEDGDYLLQLLNTEKMIQMELSTHATRLEQCMSVILAQMDVNVPFSAVFSYHQCSPPGVSVNEALDQLDRLPTNGSFSEPEDKDRFNFWVQASNILLLNDDASQQAAAHAMLNAVLLLNQPNSDAPQLQPDPKTTMALWTSVAWFLAENGYYTHAERAFSYLSTSQPNNATLLTGYAMVLFVNGDLETAIHTFQHADDHARGLPADIPSLWLVVVLLRRLATFEHTTQNKGCMMSSMSSQILSDGLPKCCDVGYVFQSDFVSELFNAYTQLAVYFDELGGFDQSLRFLRMARNLCGPQTGLDARIALAVPIVFQDAESTTAILSKVMQNIENLEKKLLNIDAPTVSIGENAVKLGDHAYSPETAAHLRWTITPSTMFIGYQGVSVRHVQERIVAMNRRLVPSMAQPFQPVAKDPKQLPRLGFVSSWFRQHSVGKLFHGIVEHLNKEKFHVSIFAAKHFFAAGDELTEKFQDAADEFIHLSPSRDEAIQQILHAKLDVLVYPELGMDAWLMSLAYQRLAPIQCVFWGHPVTTGMDTIDYFISSELFIEDFYDPPKDGVVSNSEYSNMQFSEQMVLFQSLSTYFVMPKAQNSNENARQSLHLPDSARIYVCPQTLMKFHVDFDDVLHGILQQDPEGYIVLVYSETQKVWKEKLISRWRRRMPHDHQRIIFFKKLQHQDFLGLLKTSQVALDPFPWGGGVTTLDAFAVGTPVVTLPTKQTGVQLAAGFYRYIQFNDCIVSSTQEYIRLAVQLATNSKVHARVSDAIEKSHRGIFQDDLTSREWDSFFTMLV